MKYLEMKKRAFMSIVNAVKGFVRTISDIPPITLPDCVDEKSLIGYSISGNSVQNGEPTPENPIEIESVGDYDEETGKYKIPIKMSGKNLFNPEEVIAKFQNGETYKSGSYTCTSFQLKPNTTYYMKTFNPTPVSSSGGRFFMSKSSSVNASVSSTISVIDETNHQYPRKNEKSVTTDDTGLMYIGYYAVVGDTEKYRILRENQIQIIEGSFTSETAPDYEPYVEPTFTNIYLDEPLRKVGDYADYIDFDKQKVVRKVGYHIFDGSEEWIQHTTTNGGYGVFRNEGVLEPLLGASITATFMTHFVITDITSTATWEVGWYRNQTASGAIGGSRIYISAYQTTVADFKQWIAENRIGYMYPLATDIEIPISLPKLPTVKGTTVYSIETSIQPTNMSATYYSTMKE